MLFEHYCCRNSYSMQPLDGRLCVQTKTNLKLEIFVYRSVTFCSLMLFKSLAGYQH